MEVPIIFAAVIASGINFRKAGGKLLIQKSTTRKYLVAVTGFRIGC